MTCFVVVFNTIRVVFYADLLLSEIQKLALVVKQSAHDVAQTAHDVGVLKYEMTAVKETQRRLADDPRNYY